MSMSLIPVLKFILRYFISIEWGGGGGGLHRGGGGGGQKSELYRALQDTHEKKLIMKWKTCSHILLIICHFISIVAQFTNSFPPFSKSWQCVNSFPCFALPKIRERICKSAAFSLQVCVWVSKCLVCTAAYSCIWNSVCMNVQRESSPR